MEETPVEAGAEAPVETHEEEMGAEVVDENPATSTPSGNGAVL